MPKQEAPLHQLQSYLPEGCLEEVLYYLQHYKVQLTVTRERKSVLGDYRNSHAGKNREHRHGNVGNFTTGESHSRRGALLSAALPHARDLKQERKGGICRNEPLTTCRNDKLKFGQVLD